MRKGICVFLVIWNCVAAAQIIVDRVHMTEAVSEARLIKKVSAEYPADVHATGDVVFKALIDQEGNVQRLEAISGNPMLIPSAMIAAKQYRYKPYRLNGEPIKVETLITIPFTPPPVKEVKPVQLSERESQSLCSGLCGKMPPRIYPKEALEKHIEGPVELRAIIDTEGNVKSVSAVSGDPILVPAAIKAVSQWKYKPYAKDGRPIEVEVPVTVNFHIGN